MTAQDSELRLYRFIDGLQSKFGEGRDVEQVVRSALRETSTFLGAAAASLSAVPPGESTAVVLFNLPIGTGWDADLLTRFFRGERPEIPANILLAPIQRRSRTWRVMALGGATPSVDDDRLKTLAKIARTVSDLVTEIDRRRIVEVRSKIELKIMQELRPKDLFYQILHGLRTLTGYDHSAALFTAGAQGDALTLAAEQIAWRKGKSHSVGLRLTLDAECQRLLNDGQVYGFERDGVTWRDWTGHGAEALAGLFDYHAGSDAERRESGMLCAPLVTGEGLIGALKIAAKHPGSLGVYEVELVQRFMSQVSVTIHNSRGWEALEAQMLEVEKKTAMADLARTVSHDVNNALGSVLPLVQQLVADGREGRLDTASVGEDLEEIERSLQVCRRIFGGMLAFARGGARGSGVADVAAAVDAARAILADGMSRRRIRFEADLPAALPPIGANQSDLEQLFLNLMSNARDAMPEGGVLSVGAHVLDGFVEVRVEDDGVGIAEHDLARVQEPFYTTKQHGSGLGLAICRSILWGLRGEFTIDSRPGEGTRIRLTLPIKNARSSATEDD